MKPQITSLATSLPLVLTVVLFAAFAVTLDNFASTQNTYAILQTFALLGLITLGLSMTMLVGEFDLSVGSMVAVAGLITLKVGGDDLVTGAFAAMAFALLVGMVNALVFVWLRLSSLVVTVGTMIALSGFAYWLAGGKIVSTDNFDAGAFWDDSIFGIFSARSLLTLSAFGLMAGVLRFTRLGRDMVATGSRVHAAQACGVPIGRVHLFAFVFSSLCAGLAGVLLSISLATASATMGSNLLLQAVSAAIIGGVALAGGIGKPSGVLLGVLILTILNNGMSLLGAGSAAILLTNGVLLLIVVVLDGKAAAMFQKFRSKGLVRQG
ncbi:ribose/xylose/arabinose/galactoside ABC-type transport system permease subunit [Pseudomonas hunanensis]|uniref:Ribose/xylose/arabinose/galactoside ABC-type transport system permease subunit n=1 Tax=Pseudomonas hunanensis TaxID=1247546 RepID=A0ACC6JY23_9PSED|nr:ABC transporter permease [Pseudomonas hunanensis]MDR6711096.1 ribose/xylose/arabinose/galactoside ABC-type transport system permease subunit [Pseudomonas hunanensis]